MAATYFRSGHGKSRNARAAESFGKYPASTAARVLGISPDLLKKDAEAQAEIVMHTRWPRFFALVVDELAEPERLAEAGVPVLKLPDAAGLGWMVVLFIDQPVEDPSPLIEEAASLKTNQAMRDLYGF